MTLLALLGCAANLSELHSARVLDAAEWQVSQANTVVVPTSTVRNSIEPALALAESRGDGEALSEEEQRLVLAGVGAIALASPGYGTFLEASRGFEGRWEASARVGNGVYALGARKGWDFEPWYLSAGLRLGYSGGGSWLGALDTLNSFARVASLRRADLGLSGSAGLELGEWGRLWFGLKWIESPYRLEVDASRIGLGSTTSEGWVHQYGSFVGGGVGFRWVHLVGELSVLRSAGEVDLYDSELSLKGFVISPTWGLQVTW